MNNSKIDIYKILNSPVIFDANIFMVGIEKRHTDKNFSFENIKNTYIEAIFNLFKKIIIHEFVFTELDSECKEYIHNQKNVTIVNDSHLYGQDPIYTSTLNSISQNDLVKYIIGQSKNKGEIYSLAYAVHNDIFYFCSRDKMVDVIASKISCTKKITILTFDKVLLLAFIYHKNNNTYSLYIKSIKSLYKSYCKDLIKRYKLPKTFSEYIKMIQK